MIFVSVGTDEHSFDRLIRVMDEIAGEIKEDVIMQIGYTRYKPKKAKWFRFTTEENIDKLYRNARVIVCHAGAGSIIRALTYGKKPIVMARLKQYGEHVNDHQLDILKFFKRNGLIYSVKSKNEIKVLLRHTNMKYSGSNNKRMLITFVRTKLIEWEREKD